MIWLSHMSKKQKIIENTSWIRMHSEFRFMQNETRKHIVRITMNEFENRDIQFIQWFSYFSDLNLIEIVWNWMKNYIQNHYNDKMNYDRLREIVKAIWNAIEQCQLNDLIDFLRKRCLIVIAADERHTKYWFRNIS